MRSRILLLALLLLAFLPGRTRATPPTTHHPTPTLTTTPAPTPTPTVAPTATPAASSVLAGQEAHIYEGGFEYWMSAYTADPQARAVFTVDVGAIRSWQPIADGTTCQIGPDMRRLMCASTTNSKQHPLVVELQLALPPDACGVVRIHSAVTAANSRRDAVPVVLTVLRDAPPCLQHLPAVQRP